MDTQFTDNEYSFIYCDGIENNYWNKARNKTILKKIKRLPVKNILDIGCGRGVVTDHLFKNGVCVTGIELGITTPISNSKVPIQYNSDALSIPAEKSITYDTLTLFDVLEHIEDPVQFLTNLNAHFKNVEYLVLTVPARQELWTNFDEYNRHFKRYDLETLKKEIEKSGFKIEENFYFFHLLYVVIKLNNALFKKRAIQFKAPTGIVKMIHACIAGLLYFSDRIIPNKIVGSSVMCVAKKIKK